MLVTRRSKEFIEQHYTHFTFGFSSDAVDSENTAEEQFEVLVVHF